MTRSSSRTRMHAHYLVNNVSLDLGRVVSSSIVHSDLEVVVGCCGFYERDVCSLFMAKSS